MSKEENPLREPSEPKDPERLWGPDGPRFSPMPSYLVPKEGSKLSSYGMRILRAIQPRQGLVTEYRVGEIIRAHGDWASFQQGINQLIEGGYITKDENDTLSLTEKGSKELY